MYSQICVYIKPIINSSDSFIVHLFGEMMYKQLMKHLGPTYIKDWNKWRTILYSSHHYTPHTSKKQQFILLSTISNYHWYNLPSLKASTCSSKVQVYTYRYIILSTHPSWPNMWNEWRRFLHSTVHTSSPRNRVMYLTANCQDGLYHTVKECLKDWQHRMKFLLKLMILQVKKDHLEKK